MNHTSNPTAHNQQRSASRLALPRVTLNINSPGARTIFALADEGLIRLRRVYRYGVRTLAVKQ